MRFETKTTRFKENYAAIVVYFPVLISGIQAGFPAFLIPQLEREQGLDSETTSWLATVAYFSLLLGPLMMVFIIDKFGRKTNLKLVLLLYIIGWTVVLISPNFMFLLIGTTLCGAAAGASPALASTYVSETCRASTRGSLLSMIGIIGIIGTSFVFTLEFLLPWRVAVLIILFIAVIGYYQLRVIPESKQWYIMRNMKPEAIRSATWFSNTNKSIKEVEILHTFMQFGKNFVNEEDTKLTKITCFSLKHMTMKPFLLSTVVTILRCGTGKLLFTVYPVDMFRDLGTPYSGSSLGIGYGIINILGCIGNFMLFTSIDRFSRKKLLYLIGTIMIASLTTVIFLQSGDESDSTLSNLKVMCIYIYLMLDSTAFYCLLSVMNTEVVPTMQRGVVLSLQFIITHVVSAIYIKLFPLLESSMSFNSLCLYFLINLILIVIIVKLYYPETRGKMFTGYEKLITNALKSGDMERMLGTDWLRDDDIQKLLLENDFINIDILKDENLNSITKEFADHIKSNVDMKSIASSDLLSEEKQPLINGEKSTGPMDLLPIPPENAERFLMSVKNNVDSFLQNNDWVRNPNFWPKNHLIMQKGQSWFMDNVMRNGPPKMMGIPGMTGTEMPSERRPRERKRRQNNTINGDVAENNFDNKNQNHAENNFDIKNQNHAENNFDIKNQNHAQNNFDIKNQNHAQNNFDIKNEKHAENNFDNKDQNHVNHVDTEDFNGTA